MIEKISFYKSDGRDWIPNSEFDLEEYKKINL